MLRTALASPGHVMGASESLFETIFPQEWHWENFSKVWKVIPFWRYYANSLFIAALVTVGQVVTSACAAFAFARLEWPGRDKVFFAYLATMMVPSSVTLIPNFVTMRYLPEMAAWLFPSIDWIGFRYLGMAPQSPAVGRLIGLDSYFCLSAAGMFSAYGTFMLRQFFLSIPRSLDEAATIDGCSPFRILWKIILPLSLPGLASLGIFTFLGNWGSFVWPLIVTNTDELRTLPLALQAFQGQYGTEWHLMMAAALLMLLPQFLIFIFGQRFFISGTMIGGVKG